MDEARQGIRQYKKQLVKWVTVTGAVTAAYVLASRVVALNFVLSASLPAISILLWKVSEAFGDFRLWKRQLSFYMHLTHD
jgi:hypothetical protein